MVWPGIALLACVCCAGSPGQGDAAAPDQLDAVVDVLVSSLRPDPDGRHHANLMSLRMLADPSLVPLFEALRESPDWTTRVDAILGLAEAGGTRSIRPEHVTALATERDRGAVVLSAIGLDLIDTRSARELLSAEGIPPLEHLILLAMAREPGMPVADPEFLRSRTGNASLSEDGMASLLLMASGDTSAWLAFSQRLSPLPVEQREAVATEVARSLVAYRLPECAPALARLAWELELPLASERTVVATLLALDDPGAMDAWRHLMRRSVERRDRVRNALTLIAEGPDEGALREDDAFGADDELMAALRESMLRRDTVEERVSHVAALVRLGHVPSAQAAAILADRLSGPTAMPIWKAILEAALGERSSAALRGVASQAATAMARHDPEALVDLAIGTPESFRLACLMALLRADTAQAAQATQPLRAGLGRKGEALAVLALANQGGELAPEDRATLTRAALGGADLDPVLQVQAAWIAAMRAGRTDRVIQALGAAQESLPTTPPASP